MSPNGNARFLRKRVAMCSKEAIIKTSTKYGRVGAHVFQCRWDGELSIGRIAQAYSVCSASRCRIQGEKWDA